jgi:hypothetical protein
MTKPRVYVVYRVTNRITGEFYVGKHSTSDVHDSYLGSGKRIKQAVLDFGRENFDKEILHVFDNRDEANAKEKELVVLQPEAYNLCLGGHGSFSYINSSGMPKFKGRTHSDKTKQIISEKGKGNTRRLGQKLSAETKQLIGANSKEKLTGKPKSDEHKRNLSIAAKAAHERRKALRNAALV